MAVFLLIGVIILIGLSLFLVFIGYKTIRKPIKYNILISVFYAFSAAILFLCAVYLFFYTLHSVLGAE